MTPEEIQKQKEDKQKAADALRVTADAAHQHAADHPGDKASQDAADQAEDAATKAQGEADAIVVPALEEDEDAEDIDFEKEAEALANIGRTPANPPSRTELEKAERALHFNAEQVRKLGGDPTKVITPPAVVPPVVPPKQDEDVSNFVSKDDYALEQARKLAGSEAEVTVLMHHYKHSIQKTGDIMKDIENAYFIAHKGKIRRSFEEIRRAGFSRPAPAGGPGRERKIVDTKVPQLSAADQSHLRRRGYTPKPDGSWESKRYTLKWDPTKRDFISAKK